MSTIENPDFARFGDNLRTLRNRHGLTLTQLATELGYKAHGHLSDIETGKKIPSLALVFKVSRFFGVSADVLIRDDLKITDQSKSMAPTNKSIAFVHRAPNETELARLRLLLSTFQDGTGMLAVDNNSATLPGWRDFERAVSLAFGGVPSENKDVMDVRLPDHVRPDVYFGLSCKMRRELNRVTKDGRVTIELSNAARAFWNRLGNFGITAENYRNHAPQVGSELIALVGEWHTATSIASGGDVDLAGSYYLTLMWNDDGEYQLHQFPIGFPDPTKIRWYCPVIKRAGISKPGNAIRGDDDDGTLFEWYGQSGGQLKYYPKADDALWHSDVFRLEPLPIGTSHGLISKAQSYYSNIWPKGAD